MRHAIAEARDAELWPDDCLRPLSEEGSELFRRGARGLRALGVDVDAVLTSPCLRAVETARILSEEAGWAEAELRDELRPETPASAAYRVLGAPAEESVALVGHEPALGELASLLVTGDERAAAFELKKGGVVCIRLPERSVPGDGVLRLSLSPKVLRRLGG